MVFFIVIEIDIDVLLGLFYSLLMDYEVFWGFLKLFLIVREVVGRLIFVYKGIFLEVVMGIRGEESFILCSFNFLVF